jgi:hypothetical protein
LAASKEDLEEEIAKTQAAIEKLALLLAEGKINEQSYLGSVKVLEERIKKLSSGVEALPNHHVAPSNIPQSSTLEEALTEKPTVLWYLVPFFFGLPGGLVGYVGTKDRDENMAQSLLIFGIIWSVILFLVALVFWASVFSSIYHR